MRKLTKDQKHYRKLKKDGEKDFRYTDKPEKGKFFRHVRVTRKPLSVRVKQEAYDKLQQLSAKLKLDKWAVLSHILIHKLPRYAGNNPSMAATKRYLWDDPIPAEKIQYKGSTGVKQLTYWVTSTAWHKLDVHKRTVGMSKARIVQSVIMDYKPCTQATLDRAKKYREKWKEINEAYKTKAKRTADQERPPAERRSTNKLYINSNFEIKHKLGFPIEKWFDEEFEQFDQLLPIANKLIKERELNAQRSLGKTEEEVQKYGEESRLIKYLEESEKLADEHGKIREELDED